MKRDDPNYSLHHCEACGGEVDGPSHLSDSYGLSVCDVCRRQRYGTIWDNDEIQFARLISELQVVDAFTDDVIKKVCEEMDLDQSRIHELIDRATILFERIKRVL